MRWQEVAGLASSSLPGTTTSQVWWGTSSPCSSTTSSPPLSASTWGTMSPTRQGSRRGRPRQGTGPPDVLHPPPPSLPPVLALWLPRGPPPPPGHPACPPLPPPAPTSASGLDRCKECEKFHQRKINLVKGRRSVKAPGPRGARMTLPPSPAVRRREEELRGERWREEGQ